MSSESTEACPVCLGWPEAPQSVNVGMTGYPPVLITCSHPCHEWTRRLVELTERSENDALECDCCERRWPSTRKYAGLGYWCDRCMNDGCMSDEADAQNPSVRPPYFANRDRVHAEMAAEARHEQ